MNTQQPEALRLADEIFKEFPYYKKGHQWSAELRRLHSVNAELLEALNEMNNWLVCACIATDEDMAQSFQHMQQVAETAIAKAQE